MNAYVALLRAVNVGGTGKLPMAELKAMCESCGFLDVRTYIASGNVVFRANGDEAKVRRALAKALHDYAGKPVAVFIRTAKDMAAVVAANPFPDAPGNRLLVTFLDDAPPGDCLAAAAHVGDERMALGKREIYVRYGDAMAQSKLRIPAANAGTARNFNTVAKLAEIVAELRS